MMTLSLGAKIGAAFGVVLLMLSAIGAVTHWAANIVVDSAEKTERVRAVLGRLVKLSAELEQAEGADSHHATIQRLDQEISELRRVFASERDQSPELESVARRVKLEAAAASESAMLPKTLPADAAAEVPLRRTRQRLNDELRKVITNTERRQADRSRRWMDSAAATARAVIPIITYGTPLAFLLVFLIGFFTTRSAVNSARQLALAAEGTGEAAENSAGVSTRDAMSRLAGSLGGVAQRVRQSRRTLQHEIRMLRSILDNMSDGVVVAGPDGDTVLANPAALQLLGASGTDRPLDKFWERNSFYMPDAVTPYPVSRLPLASALRGRTVDWTEVAVRPPDAPEGRWLTVAARPLAGEDGISRGGVIVLNDLTDRRRAESALRDSERLLRAVLDTLPVGVWVADPAGNITMANPASQEIWGGARYVGVEQYQEFHAWTAETHLRMQRQEWPLARAVATGQASLGEILDIETFDGSRKTIQHSAVPVRDSNRQIVAFIAVTQDITEARHSEAQVRELLQQLRQRARPGGGEQGAGGLLLGRFARPAGAVAEH